METESSANASSPKLTLIFYNERSLRAGWRLLIYIGMIWLLIFGGGLIAKRLTSGQTRGAPSSEFVRTMIQAAVELILFLVLLFLAWVMSKIERRKLGVYGLPLQRPVLSGFIRGYFFWGFLPLAILLSILRALRVFYFGNISVLNAQILGWGVLWFFFFLLVGFFEEYSFRGYFLCTLADGIGFWPAAIIQSILFAWVHMGNGGETRVGIVAAGIFALFAAATLWRTGNLWLAVGAHAGWDWGQSFFFGVNDSGLQVPGHLFNPHLSQGPDWLTGGSVGPEGSVVTLVLWVLMTIFFLALYRTRREPVLVISEGRKY
ncbi:MAG TPA: CPBP family intramembrane glutamic endopeptidase [Candidatus Polarisedimenticolia bacterium]|jgi:membrane protease YdiL (CAAX protease family)|nr:CPBP family intramembrane glutamic endopeptidase [Candidatus Polarisedimenticolia bacterium]